MARCRYNIDIVAAMFGQLDTFVLKLLLQRPLKLLEIVVSHETTIIKSNWFVFMSNKLKTWQPWKIWEYNFLFFLVKKLVAIANFLVVQNWIFYALHNLFCGKLLTQKSFIIQCQNVLIQVLLEIIGPHDVMTHCMKWSGFVE